MGILIKTISSRFPTYGVECVEENRSLDESISSMASYFKGTANAMAPSIGYGSRSSLAFSSTSVNLKQSPRPSLSHRCPTWKEDQNRRIHRLGNHGINPVSGRLGTGTSYLWRYYWNIQQNHWREQAADRVNSRPTASGRHSRGNEADPVGTRPEIDWRISSDDRCHVESLHQTVNTRSEIFCTPS